MLNSRKLSSREVQESKPQDRDTRNKLSMRRIKPTSCKTDWNTDPTAIPFMLYQVHERTGLPVYVDNVGLEIARDELFEHVVVYLTSHNLWSFNERESENLAKWLKRGGTLLLDDCYSKGSPFSDCVIPEVAKMIEGAEPIMVLKDDPLVADAFKMIYQTRWPGENMYGRYWQYYLLDDRPAVFFSPNDDGCRWEVSTPPTASNPIGEDVGHGGGNKKREIYYQLITNWMMFVYSH